MPEWEDQDIVNKEEADTWIERILAMPVYMNVIEVSIVQSHNVW